MIIELLNVGYFQQQWMFIHIMGWALDSRWGDNLYKYAHNKCPNAAIVSNELISLPLHLNLSEEDINTVTSVLAEAI